MFNGQSKHLVHCIKNVDDIHFFLPLINKKAFTLAYKITISTNFQAKHITRKSVSYNFFLFVLILYLILLCDTFLVAKLLKKN